MTVLAFRNAMGMDGAPKPPPAYVQPVIKSVTSQVGASGSNNIPFTRPPLLAVGDYMLAWHNNDADLNLAAGSHAPPDASWDTLVTTRVSVSSDNRPNSDVYGKIAEASDVAAATFTFTDTPAAASTSDSVLIMAVIEAGTFDPDAPVTVGAITAMTRAAAGTNLVQTMPSHTDGHEMDVLFGLFGTDTNNVVQSYPSSGPAGMTLGATAQGPGNYSMAGMYYQALASDGATGTRTVTPTGATSSNGWVAISVTVNRAVSAVTTVTHTKTGGGFSRGIGGGPKAVQRVYTKTGGGYTRATGSGSKFIQRPAVSTLVEPFDGTSLNAAEWTTNLADGTATVANGTLTITAPSPANVTSTQVQSVRRFSARGSSVFVDLASYAASTAASYETYPVMLVSADYTRRAEFIIASGGGMSARYWPLAGGQTYIGAEWAQWNSTTMRYLRISESGGVVTWATSPDAATWTTWGTADLNVAYGDGWQDALHVLLQVAHWQAETLTATAAVYRGVNVTAATTHTKTGGAAGRGAGSGPKSVQLPTTSTKTGGAFPRVAGSGPKATAGAQTYTKTGGAAALGTGSGPKAIQLPIVSTKTGGASGRGAGSGAKTVAFPVVFTKTGGACPRAAGTGTKSVTLPNVYTKTGASFARGAGTGAKTTAGGLTVTKTGGGFARTSGSGVRPFAATRYTGLSFMAIDAETSAELATSAAHRTTHGLVQVFWDRHQSTAGGAVNASAVITQINDVIAAGLRPCLRISLQYPPQFVQDNAPPFVDQNGVSHTPDPASGYNVRDWVWSAVARNYVDDFLTKLFVQLDWTKIERVQVGGGVAGELHYPPAYVGGVPQWWAYSTAAQTGTGLASGQVVCPVPGHEPSDTPTWTANDATFLAWYRQSLVNWMTWLIAKHRTYFSGPIWVMHPGAGVRLNSQTPTSAQEGTNFRINEAEGVNWNTQIAAYPDADVHPYSTWMDSEHFWPPDPYNNTADGNAAPWYHLRRVAAIYGRTAELWGENTGGQTNEEMIRIFTDPDSAVAWGYRGVVWLGHDSLLAGGTEATYATYRTQIAALSPIVKTGGGAPRGAGSGVKVFTGPTTHTKTGGGASRLAGTGSNVVERPRTGAASASATGSGPKVIERPRTGGASARAAGTGARAVDRPRTGGAFARAAGSGEKSLAGAGVIVKSGGGAARASGSGTRTVERVRTGAGVARVVGTGTRVRDYARTGSAATSAAGAGARAVDRPRTGSAAARIAGTGSKLVAGPTTHTKAGGGAAAGRGAGTKALAGPGQRVVTGGAFPRAAGSGSKIITGATVHIRTGGGAARSTGTGGRVTAGPAVYTKAGGGVLSGRGTGSKILVLPGTIVKTGGGAARLAGSGSRSITFPNIITKAGSGSARGTGAGVYTVAHTITKAGGAAARATGAGARSITGASTYDKSGGAAGRGSGAGVRVLVIIKSGSGAFHLRGSGFRPAFVVVQYPIQGEIAVNGRWSDEVSVALETAGVIADDVRVEGRWQ